jgi:hypothetical protein
VERERKSGEANATFISTRPGRRKKQAHLAFPKANIEAIKIRVSGLQIGSASPFAIYPPRLVANAQYTYPRPSNLRRKLSIRADTHEAGQGEYPPPNHMPSPKYLDLMGKG